jgi:hypothetical protein
MPPHRTIYMRWTKQNLQSDLSLDGANVGAGIRRPGDRDPLGCGVVAH